MARFQSRLPGSDVKDVLAMSDSPQLVTILELTYYRSRCAIHAKPG